MAPVNEARSVKKYFTADPNAALWQEAEVALDGLKKTYPALLDGTKIFNVEGGSSLIATHGDGTLTKIFSRESKQECLTNEIIFLRHFAAHPPVDLQVPVLVAGPTALDESEEFSALYRMTEIPGTGARWQNHELLSQDKPQAPFREAGKLLAKFYRSVAGLTSPVKSPKPPLATFIVPIPTGKDELNAALTKADAYLRQVCQKTSRIGHGDVHGGNLKFNARGEGSGILDFGLAGYLANPLLDFIHVPEPDLPAFIAGYEQESGETIDLLLMAMTKISFLAVDLNSNYLCEFRRANLMDQLNAHLYMVRDVTGFAPPGFA